MDDIPELPLEPPEVPVRFYCADCGYEIYDGEPVAFDSRGRACHLACTVGIFCGGVQE